MGLPGNIGTATCKVTFLDGAPFSPVPKQEWSYFLTADNISDMTGQSSGSPPENIVALPAPVNGYRISEKLENYDNFLADTSGTLLENAVVTTNGNTSKVDSQAQANASIATARRGTTFQNAFVWSLTTNVYQEGPTTFQQMIDGSPTGSLTEYPRWTYNYPPKPDGDHNTELITPFMTQGVKDPKKPVHWGCQLKPSIPFNMPFEVFFYHTGQVQTFAQELDTAKFNDVYGLKNNYQIDLAKKAYLLVQFGGGSQSWLVLLMQGLAPTLFRRVNGSWTIISQFDGIAPEALFTPTNNYVQLKIEPAKTGFIIYIITSTTVVPWIIQGGNNPFFSCEPGSTGVLTVYSGNVTAGFAWRPVEYETSGFFKVPANSVVQTAGDTRAPTCTAAFKGSGSAQQQTASTPAGDLVYAADSETVSDNVPNKPSHTVIQQLAGNDFSNSNRLIDISIVRVTEPPEINAAVTSKTTVNVAWQPEIQMLAGKMTVAGIDFPRARSPYLWQIRCELDINPLGSGSGGGGTSIECQVESMSMSFNATSYWELNHSGSIRILNQPNNGIDLKKFIDRSVYLKIEAGWLQGEGVQSAPIFEGMTVSASVEKTREKEVVVFKVEDYMNALEGAKFVLSPFYDGMLYHLAIRDIVKQLGLADDRLKITPDTKGLGIVNPLQEPLFRFKDGDSLKSAITKIAQIHGRTVFFDGQGNFHYDPLPGGLYGDESLGVVATLTSDPSKAKSGADVIWKMKTTGRNINDTYNAFQVKTIDKETGILINVGDNYEKGYTDPSATGYLGYRKLFIIQEPALGSVESALESLDTYRRRFYLPPRTGSFELYGRSDIKPLDVITVDDETFRVMNISYNLDKKDNNYYMNIEGEWFDHQQ